MEEALKQYTIKNAAFEGPLDLLLSLIEKRKLLINDISLAQVTDDFIAYINAHKNDPEHPSAQGSTSSTGYPLGQSSDFILIASTLLLIKSKSLLPTISLTDEEQGNIEDLEDRLKQYQRIKELSLHVRDLFGKHPLYARSDSKITTPIFAPDKSMTLPAILEALREVLRNVPKKEILPKVHVRKVVSLDEMISDLTKRVTSHLKMSFRDFAGVGKADKVHVVVSFLAMLELVKQGTIDVQQSEHFDDIHIESQHVGVPRYN